MSDHTSVATPFYRPGAAPSKQAPNYQGGSDQANRRMVVTYRDQHRSPKFPDGRPWWGYVEIPSDPLQAPGVVGEMLPGHHEFPFGTRDDPTWERWEAPWYPEPKYLDFDHRKGTMRIRYDRMSADDTRDTRTYYAACNKLAAGNGWEPPRPGTSLHPRFVDILGQPPRSPKLAEAAQSGDRWLLGFSDEANDALAAVVRASTYGDVAALSYEEALAASQSVRAPISAPLAQASDVLAMSQEQLNTLIAQAVANALAAQAPAKPKGGNAAHMAKMKAAADAKRTQAAGVAA